jgi:AAA domain-containing protein
MPNAKDASLTAYKRILLAGRTGTGKTTQIWSLPGKKFAYIFDPNALSALAGCDLEYELFLPDIQAVDRTLKGFSKGSRDDRPSRPPKEPTLYNRWGDDINTKFDKGFFNGFDWLILDSLTFLSKAVMDRQLYINNRFGGIEEIADYKVVGSKLAEMFGPITSLPMNIFCTAHLTVYQDEKTSKLETQLYLPGRARVMLPLQFTDIFLCQTTDDKEKGTIYEIRTKPDPRGLQDIRTSIPGLATTEDVTIKAFSRPMEWGLGKLLKREQVRTEGLKEFAEKRR